MGRNDRIADFKKHLLNSVFAFSMVNPYRCYKVADARVYNIIDMLVRAMSYNIIDLLVQNFSCHQILES